MLEQKKKTRRGSWIFGAMLGLTLGVSLRSYAQTQSVASQEQNASGHAASTGPRNPSATALGDIFFQSRNFFIFSVTASETYYDNVINSERGNRPHDTSTNISPRIAYRREYPRTTISLDYALGSRIYNRSHSYNQITHFGGLELEHLLTTRLKFSVGDRASVLPDSGRFFGTDLILNPRPSDIFPNNSLILRLNKTIFNTTYADLSYDLSRKSQISFSAHYTINRFNQSNLREMNRSGGSTAYSYRIAEKTTLNLGYRFFYLEVKDPQASPVESLLISPAHIVRSHNPYIGISQQLKPSIFAFINVGPNVTIGDSINLGTQLRSRPGVHPSINGGILFSKALSLDPRTFFSLDLKQNVTDGFGLGATAVVQSASASLGRRFTKKITGAITGGYTRNEFLLDFDLTGRTIKTNGINAGPYLRVNLTERLNVHAEYRHYRQRSTGFFDVIPGNIIGNAFTVGVSYNIPVFF